MTRPLAIDLFCGMFGWSEGLLAEGWRTVGFDIEDMRGQFGFDPLPHTQLVIQDVRTLHGSQFKDAALIVASPPCQAYSYRAMPWKRAKALPPPDNELFETCFRIQREASEAAGRHIPLIVENVRGAQKWVGRARWNFGSFYLWGDVPALMPITLKAAKADGAEPTFPASAGQDLRMMAGAITTPKLPGFRFDGSGRSFQSASVEGVKNGNDWFSSGDNCSLRNGDTVRNHPAQDGERDDRENPAAAQPPYRRRLSGAGMRLSALVTVYNRAELIRAVANAPVGAQFDLVADPRTSHQNRLMWGCSRTFPTRSHIAARSGRRRRGRPPS